MLLLEMIRMKLTSYISLILDWLKRKIALIHPLKFQNNLEKMEL